MIGAEPPSRIKGGGVLGGIAGGRQDELGEVTAYVLEKCPVRVLVTAPPDGAGAAEGRAEWGVRFNDRSNSFRMSRGMPKTSPAPRPDRTPCS